MFVPLSVLEFRDRAATYFGDKVGVVDGDRELTYRAWAERTHRLANALHGLGVEAGDRVSFITYNTHHLLEAYYGVLEAGAVLNPVNIRLAPHEIAYILEHAGSRVVFFHADFAPLDPPTPHTHADDGHVRADRLWPVDAPADPAAAHGRCRNGFRDGTPAVRPGRHALAVGPSRQRPGNRRGGHNSDRGTTRVGHLTIRSAPRCRRQL